MNVSVSVSVSPLISVLLSFLSLVLYFSSLKSSWRVPQDDEHALRSLQLERDICLYDISSVHSLLQNEMQWTLLKENNFSKVFHSSCEQELFQFLLQHKRLESRKRTLRVMRFISMQEKNGALHDKFRQILLHLSDFSTQYSYSKSSYIAWHFKALLSGVLLLLHPRFVPSFFSLSSLSTRFSILIQTMRSRTTHILCQDMMCIWMDITPFHSLS